MSPRRSRILSHVPALRGDARQGGPRAAPARAAPPDGRAHRRSQPGLSGGTSGGLRPAISPRSTTSGACRFLTKDQLRDAYPYGMACHGTEPVRRVHMSSGTTGAPIVNPYTAADLDQWREVMGRSLAAAGVTARGRPARDRILRPVHRRLRLSLRSRGARGDGDPRGGGPDASPAPAPARISRRPSLAAIATYPLRMIEVARQEGFDFRSTKLRVALLGSEPWSDELRARIESEMGVRTYDLIGMTETGGPGMGIECHARDGIHVWDDHYLPEIVDPATGRVLPGRRAGRARRHDAHATGPAPGPLPDPRPHARPLARAVRVRAYRRPTRPLPRPDRRHGDLQGGQLLPEPGRADPPPPAGAGPRVPDRAGARCRPGRPSGPLRRGRVGVRPGRGDPPLARAGRQAQSHA